MSYASGADDSGQAYLGTQATSALMDLLMADSIVPGDQPSYILCKKIFVEHPLGGKLAESPVKLAQSQSREISIAGAPEDDLIEAFEREWERLGSIGADTIIRNVRTVSRIYGIGSLAVGERKKSPESALDIDNLDKADLYFNVLDPLNTAGSLVLNQDPNSPEFMKPQQIAVNGKAWHTSRTITLLNEQPIYIEWSNSSFGFVGRSVFQRALYPLKSFIQSMLTDHAVTEKVGLLVMKMKSPGSIIDQRSTNWFGKKRSALKGAKTGNVLSVGIDENVESLNFTNLKDAAEYARNNIIKNIATAADMPASIINQETLAEGFGEGVEDAKSIARYIDGERIAMTPIYNFIDEIVMRRAWSEEFYATIQQRFPDQYGDIPYNTAFYEWKNNFKAEWPNLLVEPDSEKIKVDDAVMKAAIALGEVLIPSMDPENKARVAVWMADVMNERKLMTSEMLLLDEEALANYEPPDPFMTENAEEGHPASAGNTERQGKDRLKVAT